MTTATVELRGSGCRYECPICEAMLPDEAIAYSRWEVIEDGGRLGYERTVRMACPTCEHQAARCERRFMD